MINAIFPWLWTKIKTIYTIKIKYTSNLTLDSRGGDIISNKVILPAREFRTSVLMNYPFGKFIYSNGGILYVYPKEILDRNAHIHHNNVVSGILHHVDYL